MPKSTLTKQQKMHMQKQTQTSSVEAFRKKAAERKKIAATYAPAVQHLAAEHARLITYVLTTKQDPHFALPQLEFLEKLTKFDYQYPRDNLRLLTPFSYCLTCAKWNSKNEEYPQLVTEYCIHCENLIPTYQEYTRFPNKTLDYNNVLWYYWPIPIRELTRELLCKQIKTS